MTRAALLLLLLFCAGAEAREKVRPKPAVPAVRPPQPPPEPQPAGDDDPGAKGKPAPDDTAPPDDTAAPDDADPPNDTAAPDDLFGDGDGSGATGKRSKDEEQQDMIVGFGVMCCCFVFAVGLVVLIVVLVRKGSKPAAPPATMGGAGAFHLSVLALGVDSRARSALDARVAALGAHGTPGAPPTRAAVVRAVAQALLEQKGHWRFFGYGEKPLLYAFAEADASFRAATDDFRGRAHAGGAAADGELVVYTLVACANRLLKGVSRLDSEADAQQALLERARVLDHEVFGGELIVSPAAGGLSDAELTSRYPEMHRLLPPTG